MNPSATFQHEPLRRLPAYQYALAYLPFLTTAAGFFFGGPLVLLTPFIVFVAVPFFEWMLPPDRANADEAAEADARARPWFDYLLYGTVVLQFVFIFALCHLLETRAYSPLEIAGMIFSMGLCCGLFGINVGHELGHRSRPLEKFLAQAALLSSLYMHFFVEHNRGHHTHVSTPRDPATSRRGETLYAFWLRSVCMSFVSAWKLEAERLRKKGRRAFSPANRMIAYALIQVAFVSGLGFLFGAPAALAFACAAVIGVLLLETVNYIEHYGLMRREIAPGRYEPVRPVHSWNSDHPVGRLFLFNLPRHSDHHAFAGRKYQVLRSFADVPTYPAGYPAMVLLAFVPPLWFAVMDRELERLSTRPVPA